MAAELILIGMGPGNIKGMTMEALEAAKSADIRRYEAYTALWSDSDLKELEENIGIIDRIMRPEVENPKELLELASEKVVALLIVGDPLQATTHVDLQLQAEERGVRCRVIHGISITNLVTGAIGLSNYRFGRQTTLTYPYHGWIATSPLEVVAVNRAQGLHTLVLLDLDPTGEGVGNQRPMQPVDIVQSINSMAEKMLGAYREGENMRANMLDGRINDTTFELMKREACTDLLNCLDSLSFVLCTDMGTNNQRISLHSISTLAQAKEGGMHCLVIPAEVEEVESRALTRWSKV